MTDLFNQFTNIMNISLGQIGATDVTLGLVAVFSLVTSTVLGLFRRIRGRG